jgi:hypothetical protein
MAETGPALAGSGGEAGKAWETVRASQDIQFSPIDPPKQPETPDWLLRALKWLGEFFRPVAETLGMSWPVLQWILLGLFVLLMAWLLWRLIEPMARLRFQRRRGADGGDPQDWAPDRAEALALLEDADRLAAQGRYDEATHLLLQRSVGQIREARPGTLEPSSTAREIAALAALPQRARAAFAVIADRVERSLFALRRLEATDWQAARAAYAEFALADLRAGPAA